MEAVDSGELIVDSGEESTTEVTEGTEIEADRKEPLGTYAALRAERDALRIELTNLRRIYQGARCIHCGEVFGADTPLDMISSEVLKEHIRVCPKHPLAAATARVAELEWNLARIARDREDVIHPFFELCETALVYEPEMGPEEENPGTWPAEHPIWSLLTEVGNYIFRDQDMGHAWMYATATSDIADWEFARLGGTARVAPERYSAMASRLSALRAVVPERSGREVAYRDSWERLQAVADALWGEVCAPHSSSEDAP